MERFLLVNLPVTEEYIWLLNVAAVNFRQGLELPFCCVKQKGAFSNFSMGNQG